MGMSKGDLMPVIVMVGLQFVYAGVSLSTRSALLQGMSPRVFVFYRQAIATLVLAPIAFSTRGFGEACKQFLELVSESYRGVWTLPLTLYRIVYHRRGTSKCALNWKSFFLISMASLVGVTINQNVFFEGLYMASSSMASAMGNLLPAITFLMALIVGLEKVQIRSLRSIAKIIGTVICVTGAVAMALLKGPKLLNAQAFLPSQSLFAESGHGTWLLGCLLLFASACLWAFWLILQVAVSNSYPDHLSLSAWMCFFAMLQSGIVMIFTERDLEAWKLNSYLQLGCCFYAGIMGSGVSFFAQSWCISKRGPLFSAMFNPLNTVIVTIFASIFLHEEIYTGSLVGASAVIIGLYMVLWGKSEDFQDKNIIIQTDPKSNNNQSEDVKVIMHESSDNTSRKVDLEQPLLSK